MKKFWISVTAIVLFIVAMSVAFCHLNYNHG